MSFRDLHEGILEDFASRASAAAFGQRRFADLVAHGEEPGVRLRIPSNEHRERNAAHQAAWRSRQTPARLKTLKRDEYLRNRAKRLAWQKAYERTKRAECKRMNSPLPKAPRID
jgi:hypothetical protein